MTYEEFAREWDSDSDFIVCGTSGSTGSPKQIKLPKIQMLRSAERTARYFSLNAGSELHSCISPDYIGGKMMLVRKRFLGCRLSWETPSNHPLESFEGDEIDLLSIVPSQMIHILDNLGSMPRIKNILIGGAPIPPSLRERIVSSGLDVFESYGMTETSSHIAIRKIGNVLSPFRTLDGITVSNPDGRLCINIPDWIEITTNDVANVINPNEFHILGRADNVIISGGKKIHPESVEMRLENQLDNRYRFYITSRPDEKWGEAAILVTEAPPDSKAEITEVCRRILDKHEIPKDIIFKEKIELTPNGKIRRN